MYLLPNSDSRRFAAPTLTDFDSIRLRFGCQPTSLDGDFLLEIVNKTPPEGEYHFDGWARVVVHMNDSPATIREALVDFIDRTSDAWSMI